jgi:glutamate carboxypeptidase
MSQIIDLRDFCRANRDWVLETTEALVALESPTTDKAAVDRCGAALAVRLEAIGGRVSRLTRTDRGDHLLAEFGCGASQILLLGHFDTVWPVGQLDRMPLTRSGGRLHGPGVFDMKAGIAIAMLATRALLETEAKANHRIVMLWTYQVIVRGVAAHAGIEPQKGASAVQELAHQILRVNALQDLARGISVNVVQVSGGLRSNVIPDEARATVDVRVPTAAAAAEIDAGFRALRAVDGRTTIEAIGGIDRPPLERSSHVRRLYNQASEVERELGRELAEGGTGGGSDGNFTAALGIPTLDGLGAIGEGAHALHEHVDIETLADRAALVAGLITRIE